MVAVADIGSAAVAGGSSGAAGRGAAHNLFDVCSRDMTKTSIRVLRMIKLDDWWKKYQYKGTLVIQRDVRELLYEAIWWTIKNNDDLSGLFDVKLPEGNIELQDVIFVWHITTNIVLSYPQANAVQSPCVGAIKALSNYMMYLAVARHDMLPALKVRSMCEQTSDALQDIWSEATSYQRVAGFGRILRALDIRRPSWYYDSDRPYTTVIYGTLFAKELLPETMDRSANELHRSTRSEDRMDKRCRNILWRIVPETYTTGNLSVEVLLKLILDAWVRMLVAASIRCSRESHAKQLSRGGELITIAWILTEHFHRPARR